MIYIGIDVAKDSLVGVRIDRSSRVKEVYTLENTQTAIKNFLNTVCLKWKKLTIASEATAKAAKTNYEQHVFAAQNEKLAKLLQTIPGIGPIGAATLIAEVSDITRFPSGKALVAFCGLDPKVKQSGKGLHHNTTLTKRGSPYMRRAIFFAANVAQLHNPELKIYYQKKRDEGKFYKEATIAVARKLLYRVFAVWKRQSPYVAR